MTPEAVDGLVMILAAVATIGIVFGIGGAIADFIPPHTPLQRYADSLPDYDDDVEIARRYEEARREWVARTRAKVKSSVRRFFCFVFTNR